MVTGAAGLYRKMRWRNAWWWLCAVCCLSAALAVDPHEAEGYVEGEEQEAAELWHRSASLVVIACTRRYLKKRRESRRKSQPRARYIERSRSKWGETVAPLVADGSFAQNFRMSPASFKKLLIILLPRLESARRSRGATRNGDIHPGMALLGCLRWLAGGSIHEVRRVVGCSRPAAFALVGAVLDAINECRRLRVRWPRTAAERWKVAAGFREKSAKYVIRRCLGAVDGITIKMKKPGKREHVCPDRFFSGHKKCVGLNMQAICDSNFIFTAVSINLPASMNDRTAWRTSGFADLAAALPGKYYLLGDAAYPSSNKVLVPFAGNLMPDQPFKDAYNYHQSSGRMPIEQAFGICVKQWGILWRPLMVPLKHTTRVLHAVVRLHNFVRREKDDAPDLPGQPATTASGALEDESWATPVAGAPGAATTSVAREEVLRYITRKGLLRPDHNLARNSTQNAAS